MFVPHSVAGAMLAAALAAFVGLPAAHAQADASRGQTLYEAHCSACHDRSVHGRAVRTARTFEQVREQVVRWQREVGVAWQAEDVDAVTIYLNQRYYRFPCPTTVCAAPRASVPPASAPR